MRPTPTRRLARALTGILLATALGSSVRAAGKADAWLRVTSPDFTVITSLREKDAVAWSREFAQYVAALRSYFKNGERRLPPLTIVIFARERDFEQYRPLDANGKPEEVAGFFLRHDSWSVAGLGGAQISDDLRRTIFHEGVHWFLSSSERINPVWLEEGLAEVFSTFHVVKNQAEWGRAIDNHVGLLRGQDPLPLERLLFTGRGDLFGDDSLRTTIVYAESWAFVHYVIYGKHDFSHHALSDYVQLTATGVNPDEAFHQAFGATYKEMDRRLGDYLHDGMYFVARQPIAALAEPKAERATPFEVEDALGRLALAAHRWPVATTHARAAIALAPGDPRGHEVLGLALKEDGKAADALAEFALARDHDSLDFQPYFELAFAAQNTGAGPNAEVLMSPAEARRAANNYEHAINLYPRYRPSYQNLSGIVGLAEPWGENDRKFLEQGHALYRDDAMIRVGLAVLTRRAGDRAAARAQLDEVLAAHADGTAAARAYANRLDAAWDQQDLMDEVNRLAEAQKFAEAVAFIDDRVAHGLAAPVRMALGPVRRRLVVGKLSQDVKTALEERRWADARQRLGELLESDAPPPLKAQARRSLDDLDRRHLGLTTKAKE